MVSRCCLIIPKVRFPVLFTAGQSYLSLGSCVFVVVRAVEGGSGRRGCGVAPQNAWASQVLPSSPQAGTLSLSGTLIVGFPPVLAHSEVLWTFARFPSPPATSIRSSHRRTRSLDRDRPKSTPQPPVSIENTLDTVLELNWSFTALVHLCLRTDAIVDAMRYRPQRHQSTPVQVLRIR